MKKFTQVNFMRPAPGILSPFRTFLEPEKSGAYLRDARKTLTEINRERAIQKVPAVAVAAAAWKKLGNVFIQNF